MKECWYNDGRHFTEERICGNRYLGDVVRLRLFNSQGQLGNEWLDLGSNSHGVQTELIYNGNDIVEVLRNVRFMGALIERIDRGSTKEELFVQSLEDFLLKDAMLASVGFTPFVKDDQFLLPLLKHADNLEECLIDLANNGLDSKLFNEVGIDPYSGMTKNFFIKYIDELDTCTRDMYPIAEAYMDSYENKTFADVVVDETLKDIALSLSDSLLLELEKTMDIYVPLLDDDSLSLVLNNLETHRFEIKDRFEIEYNHRTNHLTKVLDTPELNGGELKKTVFRKKGGRSL